MGRGEEAASDQEHTLRNFYEEAGWRWGSWSRDLEMTDKNQQLLDQRVSPVGKA